MRLDDTDPRSHALLGDALVALGDREGAEVAVPRAACALHADPEVQRKLGEVSPPPGAHRARRAQFRHPLRRRRERARSGTAVLEALTAAYADYAQPSRLPARRARSTSCSRSSAAFQQTRGRRSGPTGVNDGTIRVPGAGPWTRPSAALSGQLLRHELAHSFIAARTGGNCPTWLQEGVSQWLEGGDPARDDAAAGGRRARRARCSRCSRWRRRSRRLPPGDVPLAYAESLSAVAHVLRKRGEAGVVRLLARSATGCPPKRRCPWPWP